jgi:hypothetical protein
VIPGQHLVRDVGGGADGLGKQQQISQVPLVPAAERLRQI